MSQGRVRIACWGLVLVVVAGVSVYAGRVRRATEIKIAYMDAASDAEHRGDFVTAMKLYRRTLEVDPKYLPARVAIADIYSMDLAEDKAKQEHLKAIALDPRNPDTHLALARCCLEYKRYPEAIAALKHAVALAPRDASLRLLLIHTCRWNHDFDQAWAQLAALEKLEPGSARVRRTRLGMSEQQE